MTLPLPPDRAPGSPGWYADPDDPARERWWTGTEWTTALAPVARGPFGPEFERAMRPAVNRVADLARFVSFGAIVLLLIAVIDGSLLGPASPSVVAVVALALAFAAGAAGAALGFVGARRSETLGGIGAARASMVLGVGAIALGLLAIVWP